MLFFSKNPYQGENMEYTFKEKLTGIVLVGFKGVLSIFPLKIRYRFFEGLGIISYYLIKNRRLITVDNISNAFPEKSRKEVIDIAKGSYRTMGKMIMTSIFLKEITSGGNTYVENNEIVEKLSNETEKAIVMISLHLGGFEAGSVLRNKREFYAVFRKQKNRKINDLMSKWRTEGGMTPIPLRDNEMLNSVLKRKTIIGLASDHYDDDVEIEYFGRKTKAVSGPVLLALKYKVPLVLAYGIFEGEKIKVIVSKIIEIEKQENLKSTIKYNMQKIYHEFEEIIKKYPDQYMWQHRRWRS